jgi:hypothetical protein
MSTQISTAGSFAFCLSSIGWFSLLGILSVPPHPQPSLMVSEKLLPQYLAVLTHDPDEAIGILGMISHQLRKRLDLAFESIQPPENALEPFVRWDGLDPAYQPKLFAPR